MTGPDQPHPHWWWTPLTYAGLCLTSLTWIPVISRGGTILEVSNTTQLMFILLLPFLFLFSRPAMPIHLLFGLLVAWALVTMFVLTLHGKPGGQGYIRQQLPQALFGWSLALCIANSRVKLSRVGLVGLLLLFGALEFSALRAGLSAIGGAFDFVTSLDRTTFIFRVLRPSLNVFANTEGDLVYVASQINNVANSMVLLSCVVFLGRQEEPRRGRRIAAQAVAGAGLIFAFVMFSSSAVLVMAVFGTAYIAQNTLRLPAPLRNLALLVLLVVAILLYAPVQTFMEVNLSEDEVSRSVRVEQARFAFSAIDQSLLMGVGYAEVGGHVIHNWMLFSWSSAGIVPFLLVIATYLTLGFQTLGVCRRAPLAIPTALALATLFYVRTSVGGAGGIPSGPAVLAAAIVAGLLVRHRAAAAAAAPSTPLVMRPA